MAQDYNQTLNLPATQFPMRAGLPQQEPETLGKWESDGIYEKMLENNEGKPEFVLHDGPPYANGDIHLGTAMNKVLKDFIVKYKNMSGYRAYYVPGFDTHGLPIELKALKKIGKNKDALTPLEIRKHCKDFALEYAGGQTKQFKRLGVMGDWENPYLTLKPEFEAEQIRIFGEMAKKGYIYKGLKPVYWCPHDETALAEAEIEYSDDPCDSVYVKFRVTDDKGVLSRLGADPAKTSFIIWTTTTWTLPGNLAVCLGPDIEYAVIRTGEEYFIVARELASSTMAEGGVDDYEIVGTLKGRELEYTKSRHPFLDRDSLTIVGDHVTLESGTGCVHTAPGFGVDDFNICRNYPEIGIVVSVDGKGRLTEEAGMFAGLTTDEANKAINAHMAETGSLFAVKRIVHQYPHCWRCNSPILFRATQQWFCSVEDFKEDVYKAIEKVQWIPAWGKDRITGMVRDRADWCISRQRTWGVPIPIFYCGHCGKFIVNDETIDSVAEIFRREGSDAWYKYSAEELLPSGFKCPHCGEGGNFTKETDIMDVWFDSGSSHAAVLKNRPGLRWPADVYLEGHDQYRGWFQSSLLTSVACFGEAPYKAAVTHGWVVDGNGRKMSKSLGNGIDPMDVCKENGADILRLWVASSDYHADVRISREIIKQLSEIYRKIRNTARYILGNIGDFDYDRDAVEYDKLSEMDRWALMRLNRLVKTVNEAYDAYEFHNIFHSVHNFCVIDMSNFYLDVLKYVLYTEAPDAPARRAAQTVMYEILVTLTELIAPILAFTAEEIWKYIPHRAGQRKESVFLNDMPKDAPERESTEFAARWERILAIRSDVTGALEAARSAKVIGSSLDAFVTVYCDAETEKLLSSVEDLRACLIVSKVLLRTDGEGEYMGENVSVTVRKASGEKCERCWVYSEDIGSDAAHPTLCAHCAKIVK